jgi:hypothetical protein
MSNTISLPTIIAAEAVRTAKNNCIMGSLVHRALESEFRSQSNGWAKGDTIKVKAPIYSRVKTSSTLNAADIYERDMEFTLAYWYQVSYPITVKEYTTDVTAKNLKAYAQAAGIAIANAIDLDMLALYKGIPAQIGTPGQTPKDFITLAKANALLAKYGCPPTEIRGVLNPDAQAYICDALKVLYNPTITNPMVEQAKFTRVANVDWYVSQNVNSHTNGTWAGTTLAVDGTASEGAVSITVDDGSNDWTTTVKQGDIFTVADTYGVNPVTGRNVGDLRQFVAEADADASGTECAVSCTPGVAPWKIYSENADETYLPYQTVYGIPTNNKTVTVAGAASQVYPVNMVFHKDCMGLVMVPLAVPDSVSWSANVNHEGYSITVVKDFDVTNYQEYLRFDALVGMRVLNPFMGVRIAG